MLTVKTGKKSHVHTYLLDLLLEELRRYSAVAILVHQKPKIIQTKSKRFRFAQNKAERKDKREIAFWNRGSNAKLQY